MLVAALSTLLLLAPNNAIDREVILHHGGSAAAPFTGSVYLMLTRHTRRPPLNGPDWFSTEPFFRVDVEDWQPGSAITLPAETPGYGTTLGEIAGSWRIQAVMRMSEDAASLAGGRCLVSDIQSIDADDAGTWPLTLILDDVQEPNVTARVPGSKLITHRSDRLSAFYGRDIHHRAMLFFPPGFDAQADRTWPTLYVIGGFPGDLNQAGSAWWMWSQNQENADFVIAYLDGECGTGHHVFADSSNNGPRGTALIEEFIPWLESQYPLRKDPEGRLLTGHSSGGWSSLWLQVSYPRFFGGTWSTAPDPVDFHAFQAVDIYADGANVYTLPDGTPAPIARNRSGDVTITVRDFCAMEKVLGRGGQIHSFEWVFSPRGRDGKPRPLFDRTTGVVDPEVAEAWKAYDIHRILREHWTDLQEPLSGKIHIYMGDEDTFFLDEAVRRMKVGLSALDCDAVIEMMPGDHSSILYGDLTKRIYAEMQGVAQQE